MNRREFLITAAAGIYSGISSAEPIGPRRIPYAQNPGLSRLLLERYAEYHRANFYDFRFPPRFQKALAAAFAEPRDLAPKIGAHWYWPRFQWEHRFERSRQSSLFHWFDFDQPAQLRELWRSTLGAPEGEWCGISYDGRQFVTQTRIHGLKRLGFEEWGLKSSRGEITYFDTGGQLCEIRLNEALIQTRRFNPRRFNITPGSQQGRVIRKIFGDFMMMPSSGTLIQDVRLNSIFYP